MFRKAKEENETVQLKMMHKDESLKLCLQPHHHTILYTIYPKQNSLVELLGYILYTNEHNTKVLFGYF